MGYLLGIDVGTTTSKGVLVTDDGRAVAVQAVAHPLSTPRPGWAEEDAERDWWGDVVRLCRALLAESGVAPADIVAVGLSSLGPSMVPLDAAGRPLRPALLYGIDTRASQEIDDLTRLLAARGDPLPQRLTAQDIGPKLLWYQRHEPALWARTRLVLDASGYIAFQLTGQPTINDTCAMGYRPFHDEVGRGWRADRCALIDLDPAWLPPCLRPWEIVGTVSPAGAAATGLAVGTPVSAGVMDVLGEFLTGGATDPGDGVVTYGTTMCVLRVTGEPVDCPGLVGHFRTFTGQAALIGGMATSAALTRWFRDEFGAPERAAEAAGGPDAYAALAALAAGVPPGSDGLLVLPYFAGERTPLNDSRARGLVLGLTLAHGRAHLYRALLEGVAYALNHHLALMRAAGVVIDEMVAIGGGARNPVWTQIVSDVCAMRQLVAAEVPGAPLAAAFLAAKGIGLVDDWRVLRDRWLRIDRVVEPNPAAVARYREYFDIYRALYPATREAMHALADLAARPAVATIG